MSTKKLILQVQADTKSAIKGLAEVRQGIADMVSGQAGAGGKIFDGTLKAFDGLKDALGKVLPVADAVITAAQTAVELGQFAGERDILRSQVSERQLAGLRAATRGLVDDMTLMKAAAAGMTGDFALTQQQMENVAAAAVVLHNKGLGPVPAIVQDLTNALRQGEAEGLKKYGISVGETGDKMQKLARAHGALAVMATEANGDMTDSSAALQTVMVDLKNAFDEVKGALGTLVNWLAEGYVAVKNFAGGATDLIAKLAPAGLGLSGLASAFEKIPPASEAFIAGWNKSIDPMATVNGLARALGGNLLALGRAAKSAGDSVSNDWAAHLAGQQIKKAGEDFAKALWDPIDGIMPKRQRAIERAKEQQAEWEKQWEQEQRMWEARAKFLQGQAQVEEGVFERMADARGDFLDGVARDAAGVEAQFDKIADFQKMMSGSFMNSASDTGIKKLNAMAKEAAGLDRVFGDFTATAKSGMEQFGQAAGEALFMVIAGNREAAASMSDITDAVLKSIGTRLQIMAFEAAGRALLDTFWHPSAAASEWAAFAVLQAGAIAAGAGARAVTSSGEAEARAAANDARGGSAGRNTAGRDTMSSGGGPTVVNNHFTVNGYVGDERRLAREMNRVLTNGQLSGAIRPQTAGARRV
jgi:hypothetical protein